MQFEFGAGAVSIDAPLYGYTTEIQLAFEVAPMIGRYAHADYGPAYDQRSLVASVHWMTAGAMVSLSELLRTSRGEDITLRLGDDPTGFFPFGPDLGDKGNFVVFVDDCEAGGINDNPFRHFTPEVKLKLRTAPGYILPAAVYEGPFEVSGLKFRWPQEGVSPKLNRARVQGYTRAGIPYGVDLGSNADLFTTEFNLEGGTANISAFLALMSQASRTDDIDIWGPLHYWLLGPEQGSSGGYHCRLLNNVLQVTHNRFNSFSVPLNFWMREKAI